MIPGLESGMSGSPTKMAFPAGSHTLGLMETRIRALKRPVRLPAKAPAALNLFQKTVKIMSGKLALAATANASETRNATFSDWAKTASRIERTDTPMEAHLAAIICSFSVAAPFLIIWLYISCAKAEAADRTSPVTTAKIVAKAMAETKANRKSPPSA